MSHEITTDNDTGIITVTFTNEVDLAERKQSVEEVCNLVKDNQRVKLLIDVRNIINLMSVDEQKYFGEYLTMQAELKHARVAVLHQQEVPNPNFVIDHTATMHGYVVAPFYNLNEALGWLSEGAL